MTKLYEDVYISELRGALQRVTNEFAIDEAAKIVFWFFFGGVKANEETRWLEKMSLIETGYKSVKIQILGLSQFVATHLS